MSLSCGCSWQRRPLCCVGASVVVTQVWLLLAQRRLSPGVLSVPSSAQDAPTENVPAQICAVLAEQRLTARHHFPLLTCLPLLSWSRASRQSDLGWWGTGVLCSLAGPEGLNGTRPLAQVAQEKVPEPRTCPFSTLLLLNPVERWPHERGGASAWGLTTLAPWWSLNQPSLAPPCAGPLPFLGMVLPASLSPLSWVYFAPVASHSVHPCPFLPLASISYCFCLLPLSET